MMHSLVLLPSLALLSPAGQTVTLQPHEEGVAATSTDGLEPKGGAAVSSTVFSSFPHPDGAWDDFRTSMRACAWKPEAADQHVVGEQQI